MTFCVHYPLIILGNKQNNRTLTLAQYSFFGEFTTEWNIALAALILGIIPCLIFFIFMQKYIIRGVIEGSVKG